MDHSLRKGWSIQEAGSLENCYIGVQASPGVVRIVLSREHDGDVDVGLSTEDCGRLIGEMQAALKLACESRA